jgi:biopolymer transport protein ExbD
MNRVSLTANGTIHWNGKRVSFDTLGRYLADSHSLTPEPDTFLEAEMGIPCATLEQVRDEMDRQLGCKNGGHCNEGVLSVWKALPTAPDTPPS